MRLRREVGAVILVLSLILVGVTAAIQHPTAAATRPNVLLIVTDDQIDRPRTVTAQIMPNVYRELVQQGTRFSNAFVTNSWCCPSRASILSGQYSHTNGVWTTGGRYSLPPWRAHENSTLATWLQGAGYRTGLIGKYMNEYGATSGTTYIPPGWNDWHAIMNLNYQVNSGYYNYDVYENGRIVHYGSSPGEYSTRVFTRKARDFITPRGDGRPWFLYLAMTSPHGPSIPDPLDSSAFPSFSVPKGPNICEADVSDKPLFIRQQSACSISADTYSQLVRNQQARMLASVDRGLGQLIADLKASGQMSNTLIIFVSDNGSLIRAHRVSGKELPYEESIRVPILARWDALGATPVTVSQFALNIDLAPTIVEAAGVSQHNPFDGRSLLPLLRGDSSGWRGDFLVEHLSTGANDRGGPSYCSVRNSRWKFVQYATGERELYDLTNDPYELVSRDGQAAYRTTEDALHSRMLRLCSPPPPGWQPQ
jgi:N-acetylglucosamine-6-sulfatase